MEAVASYSTIFAVFGVFAAPLVVVAVNVVIDLVYFVIDLF